jgi:hypothetical protein
VRVLVGPVDEDAADLAGLNSGVGAVACQGLVGGLVEGLMEVIVRFLVERLMMAPHSVQLSSGPWAAS